jgi:hypothetical protein
MFLQNFEISVIFEIYWIIFLKKKSVEYLHWRWLMGLWTSLNASRWLPDQWLRLNQSNRYLGRSSPIRRLRPLAPAGGGTGSRSRRRVTAKRGSSLEFEFSWATVVSFLWGLLLQDHNNEGNVSMLALISGERQRSQATVRWLGQCLSTVRAASDDASAPRTCAKASSSSLLASRSTNCSDWRWKTRIWCLPRVRQVLDLRPTNRTICDARYCGF